MTQNNLQPEQERRESGIKNQELGEETTETATPTAPEQKPETDEVRQPEIPKAAKPKMPTEEAKPQGGPGDQQQNTTAASADDQNQTNIAKVKRVEEQLRKKIPTGTKEERKKSAEVEDSHNANVLNQAE